MVIVDSIQPRWDIDEYVMINWMLVWFKAMRLPMIVDDIEINMIVNKPELSKLSIRSGASFCHVSIINNVVQAIFLVTLGSQKCKGAPPIFKTKDIIIIILRGLFVNIEYHDRVW